MKKITAILFAAVGASLLGGCVSTDDALLKTVPYGSGTSRYAPYDFIRCVKEKWTPIAPRVREYSPSSDTLAVSVPSGGPTSQSVVLVIAQASAGGTGYTIYGDIAAAGRYVTATHTCD
ncbi:hypothetical protein AWB77_05309 [Caballeronia fortuita]|uniref:Lipoprotein n=1 Tax=Caballeronia fortuita TaxID=1777138 RepID=A0A158DFM3_9BURK|nr:hypothetical protein [Caballeronia fortuita]SAK93462.1 hypothetical protein AWB77_05309 [Caballeronia fortuita]